jgi:uncharacterized coiled-coil DUF342 family protein
MDVLNIDLVSVVLLLIVTFAALAILQTTLAIRHDHEISLAGPREELSQVNKRLQAAQNNLSDVEESLRVRRDALSNIAEIQAEVDALVRKRDELLQEWNQLDERREEIRCMRTETDQVHQEMQEVERDIAEKQEALEQVQAQLERADQLVPKISELNEECERLTRKVDALREEASDLVHSKEQAARLRDEVDQLERETARLEGEKASANNSLRQLAAETSTVSEDMSRLKNKHVDLAAQVAARSEEVGRLDDEVRMLEARKALLQREADGIRHGAGDAEEDPLKELKEPPEVLRQLSEWPEWQPADEAAALQSAIERLGKAGLQYSPRIVHAFHTAMKVNETTQMAVLAGISGTGKSQLPRQYAVGMGIGFLQVPVQPRWDSPQDLMGFYNYIEGRFRPTDMARALFHLDQFNGPGESEHLHDRMLMILLDEMNLARIEYYFSDFLSRLESRPRIHEIGNKQLRKDSEIELEIPMPRGMPTPRVFPGYNLLFAGTMNEDESTQSLSDKVVDRANILRFTAPKAIREATLVDDLPSPQALTRTRWSHWLRRPDQLGSERESVESFIDKLVDLMGDLQRPFGHRLGLAMMSYVANYPELASGRDSRLPMADQVEMRLLPKLRGLDVDAFDRGIKALADFVRDDLVDEQLAAAIEHSLEVAQSGTGSFLWRGVSRA